MKKISIHILVLLLQWPVLLFAQLKYDTSYIHIYKENYTVVADIYAKGIDFSLSPFQHIDSIDSRVVKYTPNVSAYFGLSASYKGWGLGISFPIPSSVKSDSIYGKTTFYDYKLSLHKRKFGGTGYVRYYKGFYLNKPSLFDTAWNGGVMPHRDDMLIATLGLNAYYLFNHDKFSMKSVFWQSERQLKTASTFILMTDLNATLLQSDSSIIPASDELYYGNLSGIQDMFMYSVAFMGGYAHCSVINDYYYICPMVYVGPGYQHKIMNANKGKVMNDNIFLKTDFKFAAGYNAETAYLGILFGLGSSLMPAKNANFASTVIMLDFFVGCRFW